MRNTSPFEQQTRKPIVGNKKPHSHAKAEADGNRTYPKNAGKTTLFENDDAQSDARDADNADLAFIAARWPALPLEIRQQILALAAGPEFTSD